MADDDKNKKDDIYWKVLNSALELEVKKGHLKWTMTELSRKSKITRSLIYYYFGRSKMDILQAAVSIIGGEFVGMTEKRIGLWEKGEFEEGLKASRLIYDRMPYLCPFYLTHRDRPNEIGEELIKIEKNFKKRIKQSAPNGNAHQINTIFAVYFGLVYSPYVGAEEIKIFSTFIKDIFTKLK